MHALIRFLTFIVGFAAAVYAALGALLYVQQDRFIFFDVANDPELAKQWHAERVEIHTAETVIEGWWAQNPDASNNLTILYFGGNAEDVLYTAESAKRIDARRMLFTNYRGYGATPGRPSESALLLDALAVYDYVVQQPDVSAANIVVMGRSLGSGVATHLAAQRPVRSVILITPFDSMAAVGQKHYPYFPVSRLLRHKFKSDEMARGIKTSVLMLAAERDSIIPPAHARKLIDAWAGPKQLQVLDAVGHNDIQLHSRYYDSINSFLQ